MRHPAQRLSTDHHTQVTSPSQMHRSHCSALPTRASTGSSSSGVLAAVVMPFAAGVASGVITDDGSAPNTCAPRGGGDAAARGSGGRLQSG